MTIPLALIEVLGVELGLGALLGGGVVTLLVVLALVYFLGGEEMLLEAGMELID
jgi:hypothetical protein